MTLPPSAGHADTKAELEAAERRIEEISAEMGEANARLDALSAELNELALEISNAVNEKAELEEGIALTENALAKAEKRLGSLRNRLDERARQSYIDGPTGSLELILESETLADLSERLAVLDRLQEIDRDTLDGVEVQRAKLENQKDVLAKLRARQVALLEQLEEQKAVLDGKFAEEASIKAGLESKMAELQELEDQLRTKYKKEQEAARIAALAAQRQAAQAEAFTIEGDPGTISGGGGVFALCPVAEPNAFSDDFGVPRPGGRTHQGNDIFAPAGTPIYAPFDGTATDATNSLGGYSVIVSGAGGYVYNAHLSGFGTLGSVSAGTVIGYVGNTGNAVGTPPHNHFEWHPGGGSAISPYPYLIAAGC